MGKSGTDWVAAMTSTDAAIEERRQLVRLALCVSQSVGPGRGVLVRGDKRQVDNGGRGKVVGPSRQEKKTTDQKP